MLHQRKEEGHRYPPPCRILKYQSRSNLKSEVPAGTNSPQMGMFRFTYPLEMPRTKYVASILNIDCLHGSHTKEKLLFFIHEQMMENKAHTSPEAFQTCLVEMKEDSFQHCRLAAHTHTPKADTHQKTRDNI